MVVDYIVRYDDAKVGDTPLSYQRLNSEFPIAGMYGVYSSRTEGLIDRLWTSRL